jgi:hypothetical protein
LIAAADYDELGKLLHPLAPRELTPEVIAPVWRSVLTEIGELQRRQVIVEPERTKLFPRKKMLRVLPVQKLAPVFLVTLESVITSLPVRSLLT